MKRFISKVQNLSQKAAELKAAMQQLPPKVAEVREAVAATTGQLQQLKSEIQFTVADLKAESADHLSEALQEINSSAETFAKAGFALHGVDLEISPVQRLLVHLTRVEDVHPSMLRSLVSANQHQRTTNAILSSLLQANQMAGTVELGALDYREVIVGVGPIPSVRLCWRAKEFVEAATLPVQPKPAISVSLPVATTAAVPQSFFGQSSYFERQTPQSTPVVGPTTAPVASVSKVSPLVTTTAEKSPGIETAHAGPAAGGKEDPLARFKKMPDFSKYKK
jgi:hypothetical protein